MDGWMDGWMDSLMFIILFNSISVIIGLRKAHCERLNVMKCCLGLQKIMSPIEIKPSNRVFQSRKCYPLGHVVASKWEIEHGLCACTER